MSEARARAFASSRAARIARYHRESRPGRQHQEYPGDRPCDRLVAPVPSPGPAPGMLCPADRPGQDRLVREEPPQVLGQRRGAGVPPLPAPCADTSGKSSQVASHLGIQS